MFAMNYFYLQCVEKAFGTGIIVRGQIDDNSEIERAFIGPQTSDVTHPFLVGSQSIETLLQQIGCHLQIVLRIGCRFELFCRFGS